MHIDSVRVLSCRAVDNHLGIFKYTYQPSDDYLGLDNKDASFYSLDGYFNREGYYIAGNHWASTIKWLRGNGIAPEVATSEDTVCTVGWSEKHQAYFGWSHRAACSFAIGDRVYQEDFIPTVDNFGLFPYLRLWVDLIGSNIREFFVGWGSPRFYSTLKEHVPNKRHGEFVIRSKDQARIAAVAFAESVG